MRWSFVALMVVGCGPKPAPVDVANDRDPEVGTLTPPPRLEAFVPRPELDTSGLIPDFHEELRWPLSAMSHPELAPRFDVAKVFADPGIGWIELCERGVDKRITASKDRDQLQYLRGWCSAIKGDVDGACASLASLTTSPVLGISPAVRIDLANILADHGHADKAERYLTKHRINDPAILDTLAATYVEVGTTTDALVINRRAMENDDHASSTTKCRRLVREIVLSGEGDRTRGALELGKLASDPRYSTPDCIRLDDAMLCWLKPGSACVGYHLANNIDTRFADLLEIHRRWPRGPAGTSSWLNLVGRAKTLIPMKDAEPYLVAALEGAERASGRCIYSTFTAVAIAISTYRGLNADVPRPLHELGERCREELKLSREKYEAAVAAPTIPPVPPATPVTLPPSTPTPAPTK